MNPKVRDTLDDNFAQDLPCSICGQKSLRVVHLAAYPDYVSCGNCGSAYVAEEGGERVMYGKIPAQYPETRHFALQQWVWPEAIARKSVAERPGGSGTNGPPPAPTLDRPSTPAEPAALPPSPEPEAEPAHPEPTAGLAPDSETEELLSTPQGAPEVEPEQPQPEPNQVLTDSPTTPSQPAETPESELRSAFDWAPEPEATAEPAEAESPSLPEEEDLLDSLWGEQSIASGTGGGQPPLPDWAAGISEETEPTPEAEQDPATSSRLHDWGTPRPYESRPDKPKAEPAESADEALPPAVAPFEAGDWTDQAFASTPAMGDPGPAAADEAAEPESQSTRQDLTPSAEPGEAAKTEMVQAYWGGLKAPAKPQKEPLPAEPETGSEHHEPPPGQRYRVVLKGSNPRFPPESCAHCLYQPAPAHIQIVASLTKSGPGDRRVETLRIPVCSDCRARASARSEEQQTARLQAHLTGVLAALVLVVCGLATNLVNPSVNLGQAVAGFLVLAGLGYVVPAVPLLLRASRLPTPPDSIYVSSTLRVPGDTEATETAYEWRNHSYARRFLDANSKIAVSEVTKVRDLEA